MKKVVRIKESELVNLIDKIITETTRKQKISEGVRNLAGKQIIKEETTQKLTKDDFNIEFSDREIFITPKVTDKKRNEMLKDRVKSTNQHSFGDWTNYYCNDKGTLGVKSHNMSKDELLKKAIAYYNWAV